MELDVGLGRQVLPLLDDLGDLPSATCSATRSTTTPGTARTTRAINSLRTKVGSLRVGEAERVEAGFHGRVIGRSNPSRACAQAQPARSSGSRRITSDEQHSEPVDVGRERGEHLDLADRLLTAHPRVPVGDQGDRRRSRAPAHGRAPPRDDRSCSPATSPARRTTATPPGSRTVAPRSRPSAPPSTIASSAATRSRPQRRAVGIGEPDVARALVVVGLDPPAGAVDQLVGHDQRPGAELRLQAADRARREDPADTERAQCPQVRPVVHPVRRELVVTAVTWQERHRTPVDDTDRDRGRGSLRRGSPRRSRVGLPGTRRSPSRRSPRSQRPQPPEPPQRSLHRSLHRSPDRTLRTSRETRRRRTCAPVSHPIPHPTEPPTHFR